MLHVHVLHVHMICVHMFQVLVEVCPFGLREVSNVEGEVVAEQGPDFFQGQPFGLGEEPDDDGEAERGHDDEDEVEFPADVGEGFAGADEVDCGRY